MAVHDPATGREAPASTVDLRSIQISPYQRFLGLTLVKASLGTVEMRLPFRPEFLRSDGSDWLHGGVISGLIDVCGDYAVMTEVGDGTPTIDLRIDYLRPARKGELTATGRTVKVGKTVSLADVEIRNEEGLLIAVGRGLYASPRR
jgi:uncharacterized protein (TIGR00369 family)